MNAQQRVLAVLRGEQPDAVPWFGDLDYWLGYLRRAGLLAERYQGDGLFQLHRDLGVGFYLQGYFPYTMHYDGEASAVEEQGMRICTVRTPHGSLRQVEQYLPDSFCWGIIEHYVKDWRDLAALRYWYEHTSYEPDYALAHRRHELIGDGGIVLCYAPKSPLMEMIALLSGIETTIYAMMDAPDEWAETMSVLERKADQAAAISVASPAQAIMIPENLSSEVVGKRLFEHYLRPYQARWVQRIRAAGKYSFVHMDGTLAGLISEVASIGFDVLEALTPAPVGDLPLEQLGSRVEQHTIVWGGLPGLYFTDIISDAEFDAFVIYTLEVMKTVPRYVLGVADQVPPLARWERIRRVAELVEQYGRYGVDHLADQPTFPTTGGAP
jgi:hypothetical protein